jgi:8-oxo-dGTP pyrophosphatase MutT (NUDIX family)
MNELQQGECPRFDQVAERLAGAKISLRSLPDHTRAAVAMVIGRDGAGCRVLFIERAAHPQDPWSGNIGFPGGKVEEDDDGCRRTAERETEEELGLDLAGARYLGRLSDVHGAHLPILVSCFVYGVDRIDLPLDLSDEVKDAFWLPLDYLMDPANRGIHTFTFAHDRFQAPCIRLPYPDKPVLWGLTHRLMMEFLQIVAPGGTVDGQ